MKHTKSVESVVDEILADVAHMQRVKFAQVEALRVASKDHGFELTQQLRKTAQQLRKNEITVTYADVEQFLRS